MYALLHSHATQRTAYETDKLQVKIELLNWQQRGLQQTASGFGNKLTSEYKVKLNKCWYRVYYKLYSNIGQFFIVQKGQKRSLEIFNFD